MRSVQSYLYQLKTLPWSNLFVQLSMWTNTFGNFGTNTSYNMDIFQTFKSLSLPNILYPDLSFTGFDLCTHVINWKAGYKTKIAFKEVQ